MLPKRYDFDLWDSFFKDSFFKGMDKQVMKTDIVEKEKEYELIVDLPGYQKENICMDVQDGYLTISAETKAEKMDENALNFVRQERHFGKCQRSYYIGIEVKNEDIKASYKNGILKVIVPKKDTQKLSKKQFITIED